MLEFHSLHTDTVVVYRKEQLLPDKMFTGKTLIERKH
jgi:hypothetical protein